MRTVILIKGLKRSGKDTVANNIIEQMKGKKDVSKLSFAEPMKEILADTFDIHKDEVELLKNNLTRIWYRSYEDSISHNSNTNMRTILQRFGTEAMKKQFGNDVWSELAYKKINSDITVISDWRFKSELEYLKKQGDLKVITIQVIRQGQENTDTHISERDLDDVKCDFVLENITGELEHLECQIDAVLTCIGIPVELPDFFKCMKLC